MKFELEGNIITAQRVFCIGCNYAEHVRELHGFEEIPPVIFMKPAASLTPADEVLSPPPGYKGTFDYETELVVLIGKNGRAENEQEAESFVGALGIGCDLTLRTLQKELRNKALPWECSKAFEKSAPLGSLHKYDPQQDDLENLTFCGFINGELRQSGNSGNMIYPIRRLIVELSRYWELQMGDLLFTGTPQGVGALKNSDIMTLQDHRNEKFTWRVDYVQ